MEMQKVLTSTEINAENLESDLEKAQIDLKARKELLNQIFDELSSLAPLRNNRPDIVEVLNAQPKRIDEIKKPKVSMQLEWTILVDSHICICVLISNEEETNGLLFFLNLAGLLDIELL
uniref:Uncharacterized protein n=1 Tax=Ditylenchus dipsaci TaxID=166011 RepID=A0A915ET27_9BILA